MPFNYADVPGAKYTKRAILDELPGGWNTSTAPHLLPPTALYVCDNINFPQTGICSKRPGNIYYGEQTTPTATGRVGTGQPIQSMARFYVTVGSNTIANSGMLIAQSNGILFKGNDTTGGFTQIASGLSTTQSASFAQALDPDMSTGEAVALFVCDGSRVPYVYDGIHFVPVQTTGTFWPTDTITGQPATPKYVCYWDSALAMVYAGTQDNGVYISDVGRPESFSSESIVIGGVGYDPYWPGGRNGPMGPCTGLAELGPYLICFFYAGVVTLFNTGGVGASQYYIQTISRGKGCTSPRSIVAFDNFIIFFGGDGFYATDGQGLYKLPDRLPTLYKNTAGATQAPEIKNINTVFAVRHGTEYIFSYDWTGSGQLQRCGIFDLAANGGWNPSSDGGAYARWPTGMLMNAAVECRGAGDDLQLYWGRSDTDIVAQHDTGTYSDFGNPIAIELRGKSCFFDAPIQQKTVNALYPLLNYNALATPAITFTQAGSGVASQASSVNLVFQNPPTVGDTLVGAIAMDDIQSAPPVTWVQTGTGAATATTSFPLTFARSPAQGDKLVGAVFIDNPPLPITPTFVQAASAITTTTPSSSFTVSFATAPASGTKIVGAAFYADTATPMTLPSNFQLITYTNSVSGAPGTLTTFYHDVPAGGESGIYTFTCPSSAVEAWNVLLYNYANAANGPGGINASAASSAAGSSTSPIVTPSVLGTQPIAFFADKGVALNWKNPTVGWTLTNTDSASSSIQLVRTTVAASSAVMGNTFTFPLTAAAQNGNTLFIAATAAQNAGTNNTQITSLGSGVTIVNASNDGLDLQGAAAGYINVTSNNVSTVTISASGAGSAADYSYIGIVYELSGVNKNNPIDKFVTSPWIDGNNASQTTPNITPANAGETLIVCGPGFGIINAIPNDTSPPLEQGASYLYMQQSGNDIGEIASIRNLTTTTTFAVSGRSSASAFGNNQLCAVLLNPAGLPGSLASTTQNSLATLTPLDCSLTSSANPNNEVSAIILLRPFLTTGSEPTINLPAGFNLLATTPNTVPNAPGTFTTFYRDCAASEPSAYTFTLSASANAAVVGQEFTNTVPGTAGLTFATAVSGGNPMTPSLTPTSFGMQPVAFFATSSTQPTSAIGWSGLSSGWTETPVGGVQANGSQTAALDSAYSNMSTMNLSTPIYCNDVPSIYAAKEVSSLVLLPCIRTSGIVLPPNFNFASYIDAASPTVATWYHTVGSGEGNTYTFAITGAAAADVGVIGYEFDNVATGSSAINVVSTSSVPGSAVTPGVVPTVLSTQPVAFFSTSDPSGKLITWSSASSATWTATPPITGAYAGSVFGSVGLYGMYRNLLTFDLTTTVAASAAPSIDSNSEVSTILLLSPTQNLGYQDSLNPYVVLDQQEIPCTNIAVSVQPTTTPFGGAYQTTAKAWPTQNFIGYSLSPGLTESSSNPFSLIGFVLEAIIQPSPTP